MKTIRTLLCIATFLVSISGMAWGAELMPGAYELKSDAMQMRIEIIRLPSGEIAINGDGRTPAGASCRIGDLGALQGNNLIIGMCSVPITVTADGFDIQASPGCIQCQEGASIQGHYLKQ